ncbi:MAG: hypothetical protein VX449_10590 [Pseudomonadota bacterium]|jgi:hypothetical protein|nr:hypothetical protein [Pseudomonadota bacterium]
MLQDAKDRAKWKARLIDWCDDLSDHLARPVVKLAAETLFGILASGSLRQAEIARALKEPCRLHHTQKRLSRMLSRHSELAWAAEQLQLQRITPYITDDMVLAIDPGDLNRDGAPTSEYRTRVRDGDTGEIVGGYPLISVVARDLKRGTTWPLLTRLLSPARGGYRSENTDILSVMDTVQRHVEGRPLWVIDRGGDRGRLWDAWLRAERHVLVRAANQRFWQWRDTAKTSQQIARDLPLKHRGHLRRGQHIPVRFGITKVTLREHPETPLWMIVVDHEKSERLVLVTTRPVRGRRQGERMIQAYLDRWACEEGYRFTKQGFDLEGVQARRFTTLQNLVALASLAWALLAAYQDRAPELVRHAQRQKRHHRLIFPFYSLQRGWQRLFAQGRSVFYPLWRRAPDAEARIPDLFTSSGGLCR